MPFIRPAAGLRAVHGCEDLLPSTRTVSAGNLGSNGLSIVTIPGGKDPIDTGKRLRNPQG
jgi:hypothetical protein